MESQSEQGGHDVRNRGHMSAPSTSEADNLKKEPQDQTMSTAESPQQAQEFQGDVQYEGDVPFPESKQGLRTHLHHRYKASNPSSQLATCASSPSTPMSGITPGPSSTPTVNTPAARPGGDYFTARRSRTTAEPPVTKSTLGELDVQNIIANPRLRHDINFDPELHFRPNVDGNKGRRKGLKAERFWSALQDQLTLFVVNRDEFYATYGVNDDWCLPQLLLTVKEIIQTLVPARDRAYLDEGLNIPLLMQQFNKGIADLEKLATWLSSVLKSHCAPMRDDWVDRMYQRLSNGNRNNDMGELVQGMRNLLEVLEAMKLDVANHQIRCLRPVLIEDTVQFEQRFVLKKAAPQGKVDLDNSRRWYNDARTKFGNTVSPAASHAFGDTAVFFEALSRLILPSVSENQAPSSLVLHDQDRLAKLRSDALDAINLDICMRFYDEVERTCQSLNSFGISSQYMEEEPSISRTSSPFSGFDFNTPPSSGSRPSSFAVSESATSSPRSSGLFSMPVTSHPESTETQVQRCELYKSFVALLQTSPPASRNESRWASLAPALALQIFRSVSAPSDMLPVFEAKLTEHLARTNEAIYRDAEIQFHSRLFAEIQRRVRDLRSLSGVDLFAVATGGRSNSPSKTTEASRDGDSRNESGIKDMALRLAHMGILHWRVFADLAYVGDGSNVSRNMPLPGVVH